MNLAIIFLLVVLPAMTSTYTHSYNYPFAFQCSPGRSISNIKSKYSSSYKDRLYSFSCRSTSYLHSTSCSWYSYTSSGYGLKVFQCPNGYAMSGIISKHVRSTKDRRFEIYCCWMSGKKLTSCSITGPVNSPTAQISYSVPSNRVLRGAISLRVPSYYDRLWRFEVCRVS